MSHRVSKEVFGYIIQEAMAGLPEQFREAMEGMRVEVREYPTEQMRKDVGLPEGERLLGLYVGRPATERSFQDSGVMPDVIYLFKAELENVCEDEQQLNEEVERTLLHELGHHFGLDEENLDELGYG